MLYRIVQLNRNEVDSVQRGVPPWEIPVLAAVHGDEKVSVVDFELLDSGYPDAQAEFQRLETRYGADVATNTPFVQMAYGMPHEAIGKITKIMAETQKEEKKLRKNGPAVESATEPTASALDE